MKNKFYDNIIGMSVVLSVLGANIVLLTVLFIVKRDLRLLFSLIALVVVCVGAVLLCAKALFMVVEINEAGISCSCFGKVYNCIEWHQVGRITDCSLYWLKGINFYLPKSEASLVIHINPEKMMVIKHYCPDEHIKKALTKVEEKLAEKKKPLKLKTSAFKSTVNDTLISSTKNDLYKTNVNEKTVAETQETNDESNEMPTEKEQHDEVAESIKEESKTG